MAGKRSSKKSVSPVAAPVPPRSPVERHEAESESAPQILRRLFTLPLAELREREYQPSISALELLLCKKLVSCLSSEHLVFSDELIRMLGPDYSLDDSKPPQFNMDLGFQDEEPATPRTV